MKRRLAVIAVFLVLGAVVNVGVAWGTKLLTDWNALIPLSSREPAGSQGWPVVAPGTWPEPEWRIRDSTPLRDRESWFQAYRFPEVELLVNRSAWVHRYGFPMRSLVQMGAISLEGPDLMQVAWQYSLDGGALTVINAGAPLWKNDPNPYGTDRYERLPIRPLPLGFAVNTLFYASLLAAPVLVFAALKRRRRAKRGLCIGCGYDLTGVDACPECGRQADGQPRV